MNTVFWIVQVLLALAFLGAGFDQALNYDDARRRMAWAAALPLRAAIVIGVVEILGAIGLIVPAATGTQPWLTTAAAAAVVFHVRRREIPQIAFSATFGLVAALVALGRFVIAPF